MKCYNKRLKTIVNPKETHFSTFNLQFLINVSKTTLKSIKTDLQFDQLLTKNGNRKNNRNFNFFRPQFWTQKCQFYDP